MTANDAYAGFYIKAGLKTFRIDGWTITCGNGGENLVAKLSAVARWKGKARVYEQLLNRLKSQLGVDRYDQILGAVGDLRTKAGHAKFLAKPDEG